MEQNDSSDSTNKTVQEELWDKEKAERHAKLTKMASRLIYAPFARKIVRNLPPLDNRSVVVDLGTGPGILSIELCKLLPKAKIIGIDPSRSMLEIAKKNADKAKMSHFEPKRGRAEEIPLKSDSVDVVVNQFSFHEWEDPQKGLTEIFRVLKPGGSLVLRDFNRDWFFRWRLLFRFFVSMIGESCEDHLEMFKFTLDEVVTLLKRTGFDEIKGKGKGFTFFLHAVKNKEKIG